MQYVRDLIGAPDDELAFVRQQLDLAAVTDEQRSSIRVEVTTHPDDPTVQVVLGTMDDEHVDDDGNTYSRVAFPPLHPDAPPAVAPPTEQR